MGCYIRQSYILTILASNWIIIQLSGLSVTNTMAIQFPVFQRTVSTQYNYLQYKIMYNN